MLCSTCTNDGRRGRGDECATDVDVDVSMLTFGLTLTFVRHHPVPLEFVRHHPVPLEFVSSSPSTTSTSLKNSRALLTSVLRETITETEILRSMVTPGYHLRVKFVTPLSVDGGEASPGLV